MIVFGKTDLEASPSPAEPRPVQTELWQRYHATGPGDSSEEELVKKYLPLVKTAVGRLAMTLPPHVEVEDLYSVGLVGLLNALRQFNPSIGTAFEPYARTRIRGAVIDELRRANWLPRHVQDKAGRLQSVMSALEANLGRLPTDAEMASCLNISGADYEQWLDEIRPATFLSLDHVPADGGEDDLSEHERISDRTEDDPFARASRLDLARLISRRVRQLPDLQRKILAFHYSEDMRLKEIAAILGFSEAHICQSHAKAVLAIRAYLGHYEAGAPHLKDKQP